MGTMEAMTCPGHQGTWKFTRVVAGRGRGTGSGNGPEEPERDESEYEPERDESEYEPDCVEPDCAESE